MSKLTDAIAEFEAKVAEIDGVLASVVEGQETRDMVVLNHGIRIAKLEGNVPVPNPDPGLPDDAKIIFRDDFQGGQHKNWTLQASNAQIPGTGIPDPSRLYEGKPTFRLRLWKDDWTADGGAGPSPRAQLTNYVNKIRQRVHTWISWLEWVDEGWQEETFPNQGNQHWQFHGTGNLNHVSQLCGQFGDYADGKPGAFSLLNRTGKIFGPLVNDVIREEPWAFLPKGRWVKHKIHAFMTYEDDGEIDYWIDDKLFGSKHNAPNMWWGLNGAPKSINDTMAFGLCIYKPKWDNGKSSITQPIQKWVTKLTIAEGKRGFSVSDPDNW